MENSIYGKTLMRLPWDLTTIRSTLTAYTDNVQTLSGRFQWSLTPSSRQELDAGQVVMENVVSEVEFAHELSTHRRRYDERQSCVYSRISKEPFETRTIRTFDGKISSRLLHTYIKDPIAVGLPLDVPHRLHLTGDDDVFLGLIPEQAAGLSVRWLNQPLATLLQPQYVKMDGQENVAGVSCHKITIHPPTTPDRMLIVWLDPAVGFLPRRQEWVRQGTQRQPSDQKNDIIETKKYEQYQTVSGNKIWFPASAWVRNWINYTEECTIQSLTINSALSEDLFRIDPKKLPPGVYVRDASGKTSYHTGGEEGKTLWLEREKLYDEHTRIRREHLGPPPGEQSVQSKMDQRFQPTGTVLAVPDRRNWLFASGVAIVSAGFIFLGFRRVRNSRKVAKVNGRK